MGTCKWDAGDDFFGGGEDHAATPCPSLGWRDIILGCAAMWKKKVGKEKGWMGDGYVRANGWSKARDAFRVAPSGF